MLWRTHYQTRAAENFAVSWPGLGFASDPGAGRVIIGLFSLKALTKALLWEKLLVNDFGPNADRQFWFIRPTWDEASTLVVRTSVPGSMLDRSIFVSAPDKALKTRILESGASSELEHAFAGVIGASGFSLVMFGPPTEDAWADFAEHLGQTGSVE